MLVVKSDKVHCDNLIRLLKRAKIELEGAQEILGAAEVLKWMGGLSNRIESDLKEQEEAIKAKQALGAATPVESLNPPTPKKRQKKAE